METFNIYEMYQDHYVAVSVDEEGPFNIPDGQISIDTDADCAWMPGSASDLYRSTLDAALAAWFDAGKPRS